MASFRSYADILGGTRTNTTVAKPSGLVVDDILILCADLENDVEPTPPAGFVLLRHVDHASSSFDQWIWWKRATAADVAASNFTITHSSTWSAAVIAAVQGASTTAVPKASTEAQGSGTTYTANAVTSQANDAWIGLFVTTFGNPGFITPPGGTTPTFTEHLDVNDNNYFASGTLATAGSTGTKSPSGASEAWVSTLVVVEDDAYTSPYPAVVATAQEGGNTLGSANAQPLPSGAASGDLVLYLVGNDNTSATNLTGSTGWTTGTVTGTTALKSQLFARVLDGTTGDNILSVTGASQDYVALGVLIRNHSLTNSDLATWVASYVASVATGSTNAGNPPLVTPPASDDFLCLTALALDTGATGDVISADPSGYDELLNVKSLAAGSASGVIIRLAQRQANVSSEDPATFSNTGRANHGWTILVPQEVSFGSSGAVAQTLPGVAQDALGTFAGVGPVPTVEFSLSNAAPVSPADPRSVFIRAAVTSGTGELTLAVRESGSTVQSWTIPVDTTITTFEQQLTNAVTDYDNLTLQLGGSVDTAGAKLRVYWAQIQVPSQTAAGTHTGTVHSNLNSVTQAAGGAVTSPVFTGTGAQSLSAVTQGASGTASPPAFEGTAVNTLAAVTQSAVGLHQRPVYTGSGASILLPVTQTAVATRADPVDTGQIDSQLPIVSQSASGAVVAPIFEGELAQTLEALTQEANGATETPIFAGVTSQELAPLVQTAVAESVEPTYQGSINQSLNAVTQDVTGLVSDPVDTGVAVSTLEVPTQSLVAAFVDPVDTGSISSSLGLVQQSANGLVQVPVYDGVGAQTLSLVYQLVTGETTRPIGQAAIFQALQPVTQSASAEHAPPTYAASVTQALLGVSQSGSGSVTDPTFLAASEQSLQPITQSAVGVVTDPVYAATIAQALLPPSQTATAASEVPVYTATAESTLAPVVQTAIGDTTPPVGQGYVFQDLQPVTGTATASFVAPVFSGATTSTLQPVAQSSSGTHEPPVTTSSIDQTLLAVSQTAVGATTRPVYTATATSTLPAVTQSASTIHDDPDFTGIATSALQALTQSATGTVDPPMSDGPAHSTLLPVAQAAAAQHVRPIYAGSITQGLQPVHQTALGEGVDPTSTGTAGSGLQPVAQTATATSTRPVWTGSIASSIPTIGQSATGQNYPLRTGAGVSTLPVVRQDASGIHTPVLITGTVAQALLPLLQSGSVRFAVVPDLLQDIITIYAIEQPITVEIVTTDPEAIIIYSAENESIVSTGEPEPHTIYAGIPVED